MFEIGAPACLYSKWNKNYNNFKTKVINNLMERNQRDDDPMDNYEIVLSFSEWQNLSKTIGGFISEKVFSFCKYFFFSKNSVSWLRM